MPMREECKSFQSRTYRSGEVARWCVLDLAPEAPWRCPEHCKGYERRRVDVAWNHGSLVLGPVPPEPPKLDPATTGLLDQAEDIINAAGPGIVSELAEIRRSEDERPWWQRLRGRLGRPRAPRLPPR